MGRRDFPSPLLLTLLFAPTSIPFLPEEGSRVPVCVVMAPEQVHLEPCPYGFWDSDRMPRAGAPMSPFPASVWVPQELEM